MKGTNKAIPVLLLAILAFSGCTGTTTVEDLAVSLGLRNTDSHLGSADFITGFDENRTLVSIKADTHGFWFERSHKYPPKLTTQIADPTWPDANGIYWKKPSAGFNCTWVSAEFWVEKSNPETVVSEYRRLAAIEDSIRKKKIGPDLENG